VYACIRAKDAENIKIIGRGILDNSRNREQILFDVNVENNSEAVNNAVREHTIQLEYCTNVEIDSITIRDSLVYNIRPIGCENLTIKNVKIIGCWRYNSDGIDMHNCVNVHISDCFIRTFDDSICVKGFDCYYEGDVEAAVHAAMYRNGKAYDVFKNVLVENCVIWNDWGKCLEIGAETRAEEICNITFRNCDLIHLTGTALDCMNVDYADVHDITFSDINIEADEIIPKPLIQKNDAERYINTDAQYMPTTACAEVVYHHEYSAGGGRRGKNRDIRFENIHVLSDKLPQFFFQGYDESHKTENILISNFYLNGEQIKKLPESRLNIGEFAEDIQLK
jgi:polygalacturonase